MKLFEITALIGIVVLTYGLIHLVGSFVAGMIVMGLAVWMAK